MNALWFRYVRFMEIAERLHQFLRPRRTRRVPYGWPLAPEVCPCDLDFCEYLRQRPERGRHIFHFGSGDHHEVGVRNHDTGGGHSILAITASPAEYRSYERLRAQNPDLARHYQVTLGDIYALAADTLPRFDLITLFHLCEFTPRPPAGHLLDDRGLLELMIGRLARGGRMFFYANSNGRRRTQELLEEQVSAGALEHEEDFRSLRIYRASRRGGA